MAYGIYIISTFVDSIRHRSPCPYCFSEWIPLTPTAWCKKLHFTSQQVHTTSNKPPPTGSHQFTAKTPCNAPLPSKRKKPAPSQRRMPAFQSITTHIVNLKQSIQPTPAPDESSKSPMHTAESYDHWKTCQNAQYCESTFSAMLVDSDRLLRSAHATPHTNRNPSA